MAHGDSGVAILLLHHQLGHRFAHDVASAQDDAFLATGRDVVMLQEGKDAQRRGRDEARHAQCHASHVYGMETIHILAIVYRHGHLLLVNMLRQRKLHDESVHILILVQPVNAGQEFLFSHIILISNECRLKATFLASQDLVLHIGLASSVVSHEHSNQMRLLSALCHNLCHLLGYLFLDGGCCRLSVD